MKTFLSSLSLSHANAVEDAGVHLAVMNPRRSTRAARPRFWTLALVASLALSCATVTAFAAEPAFGAFDDDPRPLAGWDAATAEAGKDTAKRATLAQQLIAVLQSDTSSAIEKQDAAEHLGPILVPDKATLAALAPMLVDETRVAYARLALDRAPGKDVDALFVKALKAAQGRTRIALIDSISARMIGAAVSELGQLLNDPDPATALAATQTLGRIGGKNALQALEGAKDTLAPHVLNARLAAVSKVDPKTAARTAESIHLNPQAPIAQRAAALRARIAAQPQTAVRLIHDVLGGSELAFHQVAIESVATLPVPDAGAPLAKNLGTYPAPVQVALATALGSRGDAGAIPGLLAAVKSSDADVRLAAIAALGRLPGDTSVAQALATIATGSGAEAKVAGESLARLSGPGLDDFVQKSAATGDAKLRAVYVQAIADRNLTSAISFLLGLRQDKESSVRLAALDAVRVIGTTKQEQAVIDWALGTKNKTEQTRAVRALIAIILRNDAVDTRGDTIVAAIDGGDAAARVVLLPGLSRVGGASALALAGRLALDADPAVAAAATAELARWPEATALPVLVHVAVSTPAPDERIAAVRGAAGFLERGKDMPKAQRAADALALIALPVGVAEQNTLLRVLSLCADPKALEAAQRFVANPATADEARDAIDAITSNLAGPPAFQASSATDALANLSDADVDTTWLVPNQPGEWLSADLKHSRPIRRITINSGPGRGWGFPAQLDVYVSDDPNAEGEVRVQAADGRRNTVITLPAGVRGRYVWLRQTGKRDAPWVIAEFLVE